MLQTYANALLAGLAGAYRDYSKVGYLKLVPISPGKTMGPKAVAYSGGFDRLRLV